MLRTAQHLRGIVTIFHNPQVASSTRLVDSVKRKFNDPSKHQFDLEITEANPTSVQLGELKKLVPSLASISEPKDLPRPTLVAWFAGKAAVNDEPKSLMILDEADKEDN